MDKAHVEHAVGLVEHDGLDVVELDGAALHVVAQAARCRDDDLRVLFERVDLLADGRAAVQAHDAHTRKVDAKVAQLRRDLHGELARGR